MSHLNKFLLLLITLLIFSCGVEYRSNIDEEGSLNFTIPSISPIIEQQFEVKDGSDRAFVASSSVRVSLFNNLDELVLMNEYLSGEEVNIVLTPGFYSIYLEVFNHSNSLDVPVVHGMSDEFEIVAGVVSNTHVMLTPVAPVVLEESLSQSITVEEFSHCDISYGYIYSLESEYWFSLTATSSATIVQSSINTDEIRSSLLMVYNSAGQYISSSSPTSDVIFETLAGETYYVAAIPFYYYNNDYSYYPSDVSLSWSQYDITDYDNSYDTATVIDPDGILQSSTLYSGDSDFYSFSATAGKSYSIVNESNHSLYANIYNSSLELTDSYSLSRYGTTVISFDADDTIYLEITDNEEGINGYEFFIVENINENFVLSSEWQVIDTYNRVSNVYRIVVTPGSTYEISWDDSYDGTGSHYSDVYVNVFDNMGNPYLEWEDSGYYQPHSITVPDGVTELFVLIEAYRSGTVGLKIEEL